MSTASYFTIWATAFVLTLLILLPLPIDKDIVGWLVIPTWFASAIGIFAVDYYYNVVKKRRD
jgi:hypothetical protein